MIIDFHTHAFPQKIAESAIAALKASSKVPAYRQGTAESLVASMRSAGIDRSVLLPIATKPSQVVSVNRFAAEWNGKQGLLSFGSVHPEYPDWREALHQIKAMGLYGVKFHPDFQGCFIDDPHMIEILQEAASLGLMIVIHAGMDPSFPEVHHATPERIARAMKQMPRGTVLVAAHCGGFGYLDDAEKYLVGTQVYLDTSLLGHYPQEQVLRILRNHEPERLLFASDTPWDDQKEALQRFCELPLEQELKKKVLGENAARLLGMVMS